METPWGELPIADAHMHFFSHRFFSALASEKNTDVAELGRLLGWQIPDPDPGQLAHRWIHELDRYGIEASAVIASIVGDEASVMAAAAKYPKRFRAYTMVNPLVPGEHARLKSALDTGHLKGLCFFPAMHRYSIHDEAAISLIDLAAAHPGTVAFVHCGVLSVGVRKRLGLPCPFDMRFSNPIDLHAVALQYPQTKFVVPHCGAGYFREALMLCDLCHNVLLDTSSTNSWIRYEPSHLDLRGVFRKLLDVVGPKRLLFGSDSSFFPRGWNREIFEAQSTAFYELAVDREHARLIFHDNFVQLFV
jgi:predicted TIM-barrel fold metal-dependent hydrolase